MMNTGYRFWGLLAVILAGALMVLTPSLASAKTRTCPPFHLKTDDGKIINPLTGENADQPITSNRAGISSRMISPKRSPGSCLTV
jgi:hypothetical protein